MSQIITIPVSPGVSVSQQITNPGQTQAIKFTNGTPFDMYVTGFGASGTMPIPAGTEYMLHGSVHSSGNLTITPANIYNIPGTSTVTLSIFNIDEKLPSGNWPVTIPTQTVSTVGTQTLSNEGNPINTLVIDIGPVGNLQVIKIWNDHFTWSVVQSGVAHTVLQGQTSGNFLIGQAGDTSEVLGQFKIDQTCTFPNNITLQWLDSGAVGRLAMKLNASNQLVLGTGAANAALLVQDSAGSSMLTNDNNSLSFLSKQLKDIVGNSLVDWTSAGVFFKGNAGNHGPFTYQGSSGNNDWTIGCHSSGTFTSVVGTTTVTHNLKQFGSSVTPDVAWFNDTSGGSMTCDAASFTSTTFGATAGQAHSARFDAWKFS